MSSVAEELAKQFALKIVHAKESILLKLINERLGNTWTIDSLSGRVYTTVSPNTNEVYYLDGKPLVEFVTPVFSQETLDQSKLMRAEIGYRVLDDFKPASALELVKTETQTQCAVNGEKHFTQVITQEKSRDEDYRSFLTCRASDGTRWELRGYGKTVVEATADAWANFKCSEDEWDLHGYPID